MMYKRISLQYFIVLLFIVFQIGCPPLSAANPAEKPGTAGITSAVQAVEQSVSAVPATATPSFQSILVNTIDLATLSPPIPDPMGITYLPGNNSLIISDGDVDETVGGITYFQSVNVWELSLAGSILRTSNISKLAPTSTPITNEPTGMAFKGSSGQYFISDDDKGIIYVLSPGLDRLIGTADDAWTSFSTLAVGNTDPEGITYDSWNDWLVVADGFDMEIFIYTLNGTLVTQFDVEQYGVVDPESVEFNADTGTLFILSNHGSDLIIETTISGQFLRSIDISAANLFAAAGLAYGPASDGSGAKHFYIVDRGVDNQTTLGSGMTSNDGTLFEITAPPPISAGNQPPVISAGADFSVELPATGMLDGTATDDGQPNPPGALTTRWVQISGPSTVSIANPDALDTEATFNVAGDYVLRLIATDGELNPQDDVTVTVTGVGPILSQDVRVAAGPDDAEENAATNFIMLTSTDLDMMFDANATPPLTNLVIGIRFTGLTMPQGAEIVSAYVQFESDEIHPDPTYLSIQGQAANNAPAFESIKRNISSRSRTNAAVQWAVPAWTTVGMQGDEQRTPELRSIIQEIVKQPGWQSGNSLAILISGGGQQVARSYEGRAAGAPMLHVEYRLPSTTVERQYLPYITNSSP